MPSTSQLRVLNISHVHPDHHPNTAARPSTPPSEAAAAAAAAADDVIVKLSFADAFHVATGAIQRLFFYELAHPGDFPSFLRSLQCSLAATLAVFTPFAGKLTYRAPTRDVVIDCSPAAVSSGVKFVEAEYAGGADAMRRLASDDEHDVEAFMQLVPDLDAVELPAPVLAVQVTRPSDEDAGAGVVVAVGVSIHHAVADGQSMWQFMRWWSAASREGSVDVVGAGAGAGVVLPTFDRTAIRHPKADELSHTFLRLLAPDLPVLKPPSSSSSPSTPHHQRRRTFLLRADEVQSLKRHVTRQSAGALRKPVSTYVAVSSLAWACIVRAKPHLDAADDAYLMVTADCRLRLRPAPPGYQGFVGNCVKPCYASATVGDLRGGAGGLAHAAAAIQRAIHERVEALGGDPFADVEGFLGQHTSLPLGRVSAVASSNRFMAYETDFGWGAPRRVELVTVFGNRELVVLLGAGDGGGDGGVQVSLSLDRQLMESVSSLWFDAMSRIMD